MDDYDEEMKFPRLTSRGPIEAFFNGDINARRVWTFPRLTSRGPIEASKQFDSWHSEHGFPRLTSRGPIEAKAWSDNRYHQRLISASNESRPH